MRSHDGALHGGLGLRGGERALDQVAPAPALNRDVDESDAVAALLAPDAPLGAFYPLAAAIVGTAARRAVERERISRCLAFAREQGAGLPGRRAALGLATPEAAGAWAARVALDIGVHAEALSLVDELVAMSAGPSRWPRFADPARAVSERLPG